MSLPPFLLIVVALEEDVLLLDATGDLVSFDRLADWIGADPDRLALVAAALRARREQRERE